MSVRMYVYCNILQHISLGQIPDGQANVCYCSKFTAILILLVEFPHIFIDARVMQEHNSLFVLACPAQHLCRVDLILMLHRRLMSFHRPLFQNT